MNSFQQVEYVVVKWFSTFNVRKSSKRLPGKHDVFQFPWYLGPISAVLENLQVVFCKSTFLWSFCMWNVGPCVEIAKYLLTCSMWLCGSENLRLQPLIISATSAISTIDSELCDSAPDALRLKSLLYWNRASNLIEQFFQTVSILKIKCQSDLHPIDCTIYVCTLSTHCFFWNLQLFNHWNSKHLFFCKCQTSKRRWRSKVSFAVAAVGALMFHTLAVGFVVPNLQRSNSKGVQGALPAAKLPEQVVPGWFFVGIPTWNLAAFSLDSACNWKFQLFVSHFWVFCLILIVALGKTLKWQLAFGRTRCTNWCDGVWRCRIGHCCCRTFGSFQAGIKGNGAQLWWIQTCGWWQAGASICGAEAGGFLYEVIVMVVCCRAY